MMKSINRLTWLRRLALGSLAVALLGLSGCNTMHGFGEDMSHLGNSISNHADK
ncbi:MAG: entericidin A/B family lipoprotein [Paraburkholderia sp.]|uniref:Entericidin A n=1 Tax=Paraburkholderia sartisoli TaxID=83784 RepID=A0A1H4HG61_9BURK|nr:MULTISPECIES: entericidin A/B family lipoprotein [Paraburkholderia]TAL91935.1 MAG: entericidin A/B family lipoprotein [Paraburkholderia sp.]SEB20390.1 entericidin A [Paraburkholderia sartisoli]